MKSINSTHSIDFEHNTKSKMLRMLRKLRDSGCILILANFLNVSTPANAQTNTFTTRDKASTEQVDSSKHSGFNLPKIYVDKIYDMLANNPIFVDDGYNDAKMFTLEFVLEEKEYDRGISKDNQLLGIWHSIYQQCTGKDLYDGEDGDEKRLEEFETAIDSIDACGEKFKNSFVSHNKKSFAEAKQQSAESDRRIAEAKQQSAESDRRIAEAKQQSAESDRRIAEAKQQSAEAQKRIDAAQKRIDAAQKRIDAALRESAEAKQQSAEMIKEIEKGLNETIGLFRELYPFFESHPDDENLIKFRANAKKLVPLFNEFGVKYKAILPPGIRDFYGMK